MGQTLENGVYLPSEGERNCYAGLKTNWEILDQKVADVTALQQAVAGALHREIVESLPTTDIDPNTIYMILSGTSATENVYNEFMYVNNAWELIGTSATDLTNYYTKGEVDGLLLLKANASDLTSHTGDTTIHVTTADKTKWNNGVTQSYVFRYSSTALVASSTNSNALLDNTDNLKVGDKVIDSSGVLFSITAIDTQNSTFTIGTALVDLATDSDVVHKSGDETIGGVKRFSNDIIRGSVNTNSTIQAKNLIGNTTTSTAGSNSSAYQSITATLNYSDSTPSKSVTVSLYINENTYSDGKYSSFRSNSNNLTNLGTSEKKWANVYATNYYYGLNNVEFSTKFVTTDTNQTISGNKTFSSNTLIYNSDNTANTPNLILQSSKIQLGDTTNSDTQSIVFNAGNSFVAKVDSYKDASGTQNLQYRVRTKDTSNNIISAMYRLRLFNTGLAFLSSDTDNTIALGSTSIKWKDCQTYLVNGLTPSSLSLPSGNASDIIDISSYITALDGTSNSYTVSANGWISIAVVGTAIDIVSSSWSDSRLRASSGDVRMLYPVLKNETLDISVIGTTLAYARFIPCQGNV